MSGDDKTAVLHAERFGECVIDRGSAKLQNISPRLIVVGLFRSKNWSLDDCYLIKHHTSPCQGPAADLIEMCCPVALGRLYPRGTLSYYEGVNTPEAKNPAIAVIGGGMSGLAAAHRLGELKPDWSITLFDSADQLGGVLRTHFQEGYLLEQAADNFLRGPTAPWAENLCQRIGFADQLISTNEKFRGAKVCWKGRLYPVPAGFQLMAPSRLTPLLTSRLLSPWGKLRLICEPLIREPANVHEESLAEFATRRLGREAFQRLVEPLVAGIYTADPAQLSVQAALPQMVQLVRDHGSLYRGMQQRKKQSAQASKTRGARYSLFVAPQRGMSSFVKAIEDRLHQTSIRTRCDVREITALDPRQWQVQTEETQESFDGVVAATPTHISAKILKQTLPQLSGNLQSISSASSAVVCLAYRKQEIGRPLDAFGCVVPSQENRKILAISCPSLKFPGRAPAGMELFRVFVGGALQPELVEQSDQQLVTLVRQQLQQLLKIEAPPNFQRVFRWREAMPQYVVGHREHVRQIDRSIPESGTLQLASNGFTGVGIPQCVQQGEAAAERLIQALSQSFG